MHLLFFKIFKDCFVIKNTYIKFQRTLSRYFDVTHATAQLAPTFISKVNTAVQLLLVSFYKLVDNISTLPDTMVFHRAFMFINNIKQ